MDQLKDRSCYLRCHNVARTWATDVRFFREESAFLHRLLDSQYIRTCTAVQRMDLNIVKDKLFQLEKEKAQADRLLVKYLVELEGSVAGLASCCSNFIPMDRIGIESTIIVIGKEYRRIRTELFRLAESVITDHI